MTWPGPVVLFDVSGEHRAVEAHDRACRARPEAFLWYLAAIGPNPRRNQRIADGLRWAGGGFVVNAEDEERDRGSIILSSFYPMVPGDRSRWRPAS